MEVVVWVIEGLDENIDEDDGDGDNGIKVCLVGWKRYVGDWLDILWLGIRCNRVLFFEIWRIYCKIYIVWFIILFFIFWVDLLWYLGVCVL